VHACNMAMSHCELINSMYEKFKITMHYFVCLKIMTHYLGEVKMIYKNMLYNEWSS